MSKTRPPHRPGHDAPAGDHQEDGRCRAFASWAPRAHLFEVWNTQETPARIVALRVASRRMPGPAEERHRIRVLDIRPRAIGCRTHAEQAREHFAMEARRCLVE